MPSLILSSLHGGTVEVNILALDLSLNTGWAQIHTTGRICHGVWELPRLRSGLGKCLSALADKLEQTLVMAPMEVIYESPLSLGALVMATGEQQVRLIYGLCAVVEMIAHEQGVPVTEASADDARKKVLGMRRPAKGRDAIKRTVIQWCRASGFDPYDDNDADALVLLHYRLMLDDPLLLLKRASGVQ